MRTNLLLTKALVAVALLLGGVSSVWAVDITETYDFAAFITANGTANLTTSGDGIAQSGTSAKVGTVKVIDNLTVNSQTLDLKGRFALDYQYNAGSQIRFMWRSNSKTAHQHGLAGQWNGNGTADPQGAARFSVLNLKAGDKITITYYKQAGRAADPYTCSGSQLTGIAADAALASGTEYTVAADGNLDLYFINNNFAIASIVIKTTGTETVTTPSLTLTGAYNNTRKVTITAGASDAGNDITTYYTTDGSTPSTTSSNSFTTASQEITIGEGILSESTVTVKAISVSSANAESEIGSADVTVGTTIQLAQPTITLTGMGLDNEKYYKQYTFNAVTTGTYGTPTITLNATLGGNSISSPYTASTAGTISVTASADGYTTSEAATLDVDAAAYLLSRSYDFTKDSYRDGLSVEGNNITISSTGVQVYRIYDFSHVDGLTLSNTNFGITKAQNYNTCKGLAPRWGKGDISINDWIDGSFATLTDYVGNGVYATSSNGTFSFGSQVNNNTFTTLNIYTPVGATVPATTGENGFTTFASLYALDLANLPEGLKAYKATLDKATITFAECTQAVAAGTGLLLEGTAGITYDIPVVAEGATVSDNALTGVTTVTPLKSDDTNYIFAMRKATSADDPLSFAPLTSDAAGVNFPAGKAYIKVEASAFESTARALVLTFDDATSVKELKNSRIEELKSYYNLNGQRVSQPSKGLYIVNGKKVVIK